MGSRSDVTLVVKRDMFASMWKEIPEAMKTVTEYTEDMLQKDGSFLLNWLDVKWYEEYPGCGAVMKFIENYQDESSYYFVRTGEALDDNEEHGQFYDNPFEVCIRRHIEILKDGEEVDLAVFT